MPTYRNGDSIKVTPPKEFTDRVRAAEAAAIVDAKIARMKFNLSSRENKEMFDQWNQIKLESERRLQRIEQLSHIQRRNKEERHLQLQRHQQQQRREQTDQQPRRRPTPITTEPNSLSDPSTVIRNLEFIRKVVNGSSISK